MVCVYRPANPQDKHIASRVKIANVCPLSNPGLEAVFMKRYNRFVPGNAALEAQV
jgi:hypothetical protein